MEQASNQTPHINIYLNNGEVDIQQHRPPVLSHLSGMKIEQALRLVPKLLPICGAAQSIAAARAVEAAREAPANDASEEEREQQLLREQLLSAAWRLAIDWPDLLNEPRNMAWLKQLRGTTNNAQLARQLLEGMPMMDQVQSPEELRAWAEQGDSIAARVLAGNLALTKRAPSFPVSGSELEKLACNALGQDALDHQHPAPDAFEVGPLAATKSPLLKQLLAAKWEGYAAIRTAALLLESVQTARQLQEGASAGLAGKHSWMEQPLCGTAKAQTARGPVFHRVVLDRDDSVVHWNALAPTDWHFAKNGPVAATLAAGSTIEEANLLVAGFDPCVPCQVHVGEGP